MCVAGSFMWQYVLLGLLVGNVCCRIFQLAMSVLGSFMWQYVLYVLGGNVCCWVF